MKNQYKIQICENMSNKPQNKHHYQAVIGVDIKFDESTLENYTFDGFTAIHYDFLVICAAIEFADRRCYRNCGFWSRDIHVSIPVNEVEIWDNPKTLEALVTTLRLLTGDSWKFEFVRSSKRFELSGQKKLFYESTAEAVIAFSDGLDSLCVANLIENEGAIIRLRVGRQKLENKIASQHFDRIPFEVLVKPEVDHSQRSRSFKYAVLTAIIADISKTPVIVIPESGQGALGPVLVYSYGAYPDYRNHPTFLRKMQDFIDLVLSSDVVYIQPKLWQTKGQTIKEFINLNSENTQNIKFTRSCWQKRHNVMFNGKSHQCGICGACLLRRMSLNSAGVEECSDSYTISKLSSKTYEDSLPDLTKVKISTNMMERGIYATKQMQRLADLANGSTKAIQENAFGIYTAIAKNNNDMSFETVINNLHDMLELHSQEWKAFLDSCGQSSFLYNWLR